MVLDSVGVEHIPKEIKRIIGNKNIFRIQTYDWLFFCSEYEKNDDTEIFSVTKKVKMKKNLLHYLW